MRLPTEHPSVVAGSHRFRRVTDGIVGIIRSTATTPPVCPVAVFTDCLSEIDQ